MDVVEGPRERLKSRRVYTATNCVIGSKDSELRFSINEPLLLKSQINLISVVCLVFPIEIQGFFL